ncbi:flagellar hook-associated protein FlgL [Bdellovibrionota bacterium FG-1]
MRVTENTSYGVVRDSIRRTRERMETLQGQSATLRKLNTPSDDPIGSAKVMEIRTEKVNNDQYQINAKMAESFLNNSDQALSELSEALARAKELAVNQSSGASSNEDTRIAIAEEVGQLFQQAVSVANRRIGDRYLFGGYKTNKPPIDADGRYTGDDGQMMLEIGKDVFISMNIAGADAFNTNPKRSADVPSGYKEAGVQRSPANDPRMDDVGPENVNAFDEIQNLRIGLLTGDLDSIRNTLERLDAIHGKIISTRAKIGSRLQGLQSTSSAIERHNLVNAQLSSNLEDADMAQVVSDLAKEETVFRSALASSHKLIQPTLLDFIK